MTAATTILLVENIPADLRALRQWVVWKLETVKGKLTKPPYSAHTAGKASSTDQKTWATFDHAIERYEAGGFAGIGFVLSPDDPYAGMDLDHARDPETGIIEPWALDIVKKIDSYTEVSPSGTGLHLFVRGALPDHGRKKGDIEMYDRERYLTVTGDHLEGTPLTIEERSDDLAALHLEVFGAEDHHEEGHQVGPNLDLTDEELIDKATHAKGGAKFWKLWNGDWTGLYSSQSEADLAFCSLLRFWTDGDPERIDRIFRLSGLYRDKWNSSRGSSTYGGVTIDTALRAGGETYSPNGANPGDGHHEDDNEEAAPGRRDEHLTDWGNAQRLVRLHGDQLRYCHAWGRWLIWDKRRWRTDDTGRVYRFAKSAVKTIYTEAKAATDADDRKALAAWAIKSEAQPRLEAMIVSAQSEPGIPVRPDDLDADPWLFNVENGTINLRTGKMRPHDPDELITKMGDVTYDPNTEAPIFDAFLYRIMDGDAELIAYLQRTLGRSLTGDVSEHRIEMWHGLGSNGKSTLTTAMLGVTGDYGLMAAPGLLLKRHHDAHPTEVADLKGARFVSSVEVGESRKLNEEQVKQLTGGDRLKARFMRQDLWEFDPSFKIFLSCNHRPTIVGGDYAIWRRVKLIPFSVVIPDDEQDKALGEKLRLERSGILNWLIRGCLDWQRHGLTEPEAVRVATDAYRAEQDLVAAFVDDCCTVGPNAKALTADLYNAYASWCKDGHEEALGKRAFGLRLGDQGFTPGKRTGGKRWWFGIGLKAQQTMDSDTD